MIGDIKIGEWLVQPRINSIQSDGAVRHLEPKVMQVLTTLAGQPGEVFSREQLRDAVWPGVTVGEDVLIRAIGEIRRAFDDDARSPHTIQTIPKVGYRLIARVAVAEEPHLENPRPALPPASAEVPDPQRPIGTSDPSMRRIIFGTLMILCLAGLFAFRLHRKTPIKDFTSHLLTTYPGQELQPDFSPDGQSVAFVWHKPGDDRGHVYIKAISSESPVRLLTGAEDEFSPAWSPDGHSIALIRTFGAEIAVVIVAASGGEERRLYTLPTATIWEYGGLSWTPDGQTLIFPQKLSAGGSSQIVQFTLASHAIREVTTPPNGWDGDWMPHVSPDGKSLSFTRGSERSARDLFVMELPTGTPRRLTSDNRLIVGTSWTGDGLGIVFASSRGGSMALWRLTVHDGTAERELVGTDNAYGPTVAPHGERLAYSRGNAEWSITEDAIGGKASDHKEVLASSEQDSAPSLSPDGTALAFQSWRSGGQEIWVSGADGKNLVQLTTSGNFSGSPAWSPSGDRITYDARLEGFARVCVMGAHGEGARSLPGGLFDDIVPSWSADGKSLYFGSNRSGAWQIWRIPADGSGPAQQVSQDGGMVAKESLDGKWIYYTRRGEAGLWRKATAGGPESKFSAAPSDGYQDYWTVGRLGVYSIAWQNGGYVLILLDPENSRSKLLFTFTHPVTPFAGIAVSADGKRMIHADLTRAESNITLVEHFR